MSLGTTSTNKCMAAADFGAYPEAASDSPKINTWQTALLTSRLTHQISSGKTFVK